MKIIVTAVVTFVVSVVVLFLMSVLTQRPGVATGLSALKVDGVVFIYVGALYLLVGLTMRFAIR